VSGDRHEDFVELLGVYALDALDDDERALVDAHLPACPRCAAEVAEHREVAALIANTGASAPEGVWQRIASSLDGPAPGIDLRIGEDRVLELRPSMPMPDLGVAADFDADDGPSGSNVVPLRSRRPSFLAAAAASVALVFGLLAGVIIGDRNASTGSQDVALSLEDAARDALNDASNARVSLASEDGTLVADAVVDQNGQGYIIGSILPRIDDDRTYQLWGQFGDTVVSLGVLGNAPTVVAFLAAGGVDVLMITDEPIGGVSLPTSPPVLAGELS
jgi:hypothetical protein